MLKFIAAYLNNPDKIYSILGSRLNLADGDSCATIVHKVLLEGGINRLLNFYGQTFGAHGILTSVGLKEICELAKSTEHAQSPNVKALSETFQVKYKHDMITLSERFRFEAPQETSSSTFKPRS